MLREHAIILAASLTSIFNSSLRQGSVPNDWKTANVIALPTTTPIVSVKTDIRPICLTPIASKVFESIVMRWFGDSVEDMVDDKQYRGISTTDALVGMMHRWYEATDKLTTTCVLSC